MLAKLFSVSTSRGWFILV